MPEPSTSRPTDRPDAHCTDCPFADRGDWVMYRDEYEQLVNDRIRAIEQRENANAVSVRVEIENRRLREALVMVYRESPVAVARVCDEFLDRSGRLLGEIRQEARSG